MNENNKTNVTQQPQVQPEGWPFWLELPLALLIPFAIRWSLTPMKILNASALWIILKNVGLFGIVVLFFAGIPIGIIGLLNAKKSGRLRVVTALLSAANACFGFFEIGFLIFVVCSLFSSMSTM